MGNRSIRKTGDTIQQMEKSKTYKIYSKAGCIFCDAAMELLEKKEIPYEEIKVIGNEKAMNLFKMNRFKTVPQIFTDKDVWVGGYQDLKKNLDGDTN